MFAGALSRYATVLGRRDANIIFLADWHVYEGSAAANNPLNVTAYAPVPATVGYKTLNSAGVQYYGTPAQGAAATAAFLKMPNFAPIYAALQSKDPFNYSDKSQGSMNAILGALQKWGSSSFAIKFAYTQPEPNPGGIDLPIVGPVGDVKTSQTHFNPEPTGPQQTSTSNNPPSPFAWLTDLENWLEGKSKLVLAYLLLVGVAGALFVAGMRGLGVRGPGLPRFVPLPVPA